MARRTLLSYLPRLWANWITLLGAVITTLSALTMIVFVLLAASRAKGNPYLDVFLVLVLPAVFILGLLIIPVGFYVERLQRQRRAAQGKAPPSDAIEQAFVLAASDPTARRRILFVGTLTLLNVVLLAAAGHEAVTYMDSPRFCGATCHPVMQPEWMSYNNSKHSRVACVECHIGPGASWAVKSKINGIRQVWGVLAGDYHRPIPSPVEHLRPSRDTCEQCHWPEKFTGNSLRVYPHFKDDKNNTPSFNVMLLRVGGRSDKTGKYEGIHWHVSDTAQLRYEVLNAKRTKIGKITVLDRGKVVATYLPPVKERQSPVREVRTMDCLDCHNRPTHLFDRQPDLAVDRALYAGELDAKVPFIAKVATEVLGAKGVGRDEAEGRFRKALEETYAKSYPDVKPAAATLAESARVLGAIYRRNVFPEMNLGWGTYQSHIGHGAGGKTLAGGEEEAVGCFRCHDKEHEKQLPDGKTETLGQDCEQCHEAIATEEDPATLPDEVKQLLPR